MTICVIPARSGSRRIKGKNTRWFHGKPIIAHSIEAAITSNLFRTIVVSTDSGCIAQVALDYGATVAIIRPAELAEDHVGTVEVTRHAAMIFDAEFVCCLYATAPMVDPRDIRRGYFLISDGKHSHCLSVGTDPLCDAGQFYWSTLEALRNHAPLIGKETAMIPIAKERVCDINTEEDWVRAEKLYEEMHK